MGLELVKEKQGNGHLGWIAEEVAEIKEILVSRISRVESFIQEAGFLAETEAQRVKQIREGLEAEIAILEAQLREKEEILHTRDSAIEAMREGLAAKIHDLENRVREKEELLAIRDAVLKDLKSKIDALNFSPYALITLREEDAITLKGAEEEQRKRVLQSEVKEEEIQALEERMSTEMQRLRVEIQEKDVLLTAREMEVRMIKQSMEDRIKELEKIVKRQAGEEQKKSRLVAFVPPVDKSN